MVVNNKTGIVLSGGGFRGIGHLGVIQYLYELGIKLDAVSAASAGALVGAFIAEGFTPNEIFEIAKKERFYTYTKIFFSNSGGLFSTTPIEDIVKKYIPHNSFSQLKMPLYVSVTDLTNGRSLIFNDGPLSTAVKASCCVPLVYQPVEYKGVYLCDGGLLNNFPYEQIRATCNKVIGVNVNPINKVDGKFGYKHLMYRIVRVVTSKINLDAKGNCDVFIQPDKMSKFGTFDSKKIEALFNVGYDCAKEMKDEIMEVFSEEAPPF